MAYIIIPIVVILMTMVVVSLLRGLKAFRQGLDQDADPDQGTGSTEMQVKQNHMTWARIKYQLAAIVGVALLLMVAR